MDTRLLARRRVRNRLIKGMFPSVIMALSVRSMASCWSCRNETANPQLDYEQNQTWRTQYRLTFVMPRFSIAGIL